MVGPEASQHHDPRLCRGGRTWCPVVLRYLDGRIPTRGRRLTRFLRLPPRLLFSSFCSAKLGSAVVFWCRLPHHHVTYISPRTQNLSAVQSFRRTEAPAYITFILHTLYLLPVVDSTLTLLPLH